MPPVITIRDEQRRSRTSKCGWRRDLPARLPRRRCAATHFLQASIARIKPGLTIAAAQSQVDALVAALQKQFPTDYPRQSAWTVRLIAAQGERGRQCSPVADSAARRGGIGAADRLREHCESAAGARQRERTRNGGSAGARSRAHAADVATAHRKLAAFAGRRNCRPGDSLLHEGVSAAARAGKPAAAQ